VRHALITTHLLSLARETAIAQAEADQRLDHQPKVKAPIQAPSPAGSPGS
jgi:hypothetical protein